MKPKDLSSPYSWEDRRVVLSNGVLFVPDYYFRYGEFSFPGWGELFSNRNPVSIEYCSGNGSWVVEKATEHPERNWVAVEKRFDRVRKIWSKVQNRKLGNLFIVCGEGCTFTREYVTDGTVSMIYINFPDPWPKDKHAKHRLIKPGFVDQCARVLGEEGVVTLVTDDVIYSDQMIETFIENRSFCFAHPTPYYQTQCEGYGTSYFQTLWQEKGRAICFLSFARTNN